MEDADETRSGRGSGDGAEGEAPRRGRGRPHKPVEPVPSWPPVTGELELPRNAFKAGEVSLPDYGRGPTRPATFVYGRVG
jgi:hypothetical protein